MGLFFFNLFNHENLLNQVNKDWNADEEDSELDNFNNKTYKEFSLTHIAYGNRFYHENNRKNSYYENEEDQNNSREVEMLKADDEPMERAHSSLNGNANGDKNIKNNNYVNGTNAEGPENFKNGHSHTNQNDANGNTNGLGNGHANGNGHHA
eukprot:CAMPEP_0116950840 /NCGR_PEP_ID=MMETSP0467-20121206/39723_1 /TAXON_ID=283647 /ORGANISM="Mesodinium pulex, Strain SPMC105" /LENGTH=151 /DNA_ID=CAMNT_0004635691 /DNA_START=5230 /DNA_END=5685 /DNA_ORIENTATION=+